MSVLPDEDELQARDRLRALGVSYAPAPGDAPAHKPDPSLEDPAEPEGETSSGRPGPRARVRTWKDAVTSRRRRPAAEDTGDDDEEPEDDEDTEDEDDEGEGDTGDTEGDGPKEGGPVRKTATGKARAPRPQYRPRFSAPGFPHTMKAVRERRSLVEVIRSTPDHVKWMVYNGSALGTGFYLGWPQWVRDGVAFLVTEHPTLTDTYSLTCYGLAAGVLVLDGGVRTWRLLVAWAARIPTASLVVGVLMYGDPTPISQLA